MDDRGVQGWGSRDKRAEIRGGRTHCMTLLTIADSFMYHILGLVSKGNPRVTWPQGLLRKVCPSYYRRPQYYGTD